MDRWFSTFSGFRCFESMQKSSCVETEFSCFLEIMYDVPFQMMKLQRLDSWRFSTKTTEFGCWISRHGENPWQELFFDGNKSYQTLPLKKSWVSPCVKTNQSPPALMALNVFGTQLLLLIVMILSISDSWCSYHQGLKTNCSSFQFLFSQKLLSRRIPVWNNIMDRWFSTSWGFLCFESMKRSSCLDTEFLMFFGDNLWGAVSNDEASKTRLLKIFHQDYWIWLLNLSPLRKSLTSTVFWWEQDISNLASQGKLGVALRQN